VAAPGKLKLYVQYKEHYEFITKHDYLNFWNYGTFVPMYFRSRERKFHRWNFRSLELSLPETFAPQHELSVIYTDFEKAYDKVPHNRWTSKLGSYGIDMALVKWAVFYCVGNIG